MLIAKNILSTEEFWSINSHLDVTVNTSIVEGIYTGMMGTHLLAVGVGALQLLTLDMRLESRLVSAGAVVGGGVILGAVRWTPNLLSTWGKLGALLGVSGAVGVALSAAAGAAGQRYRGCTEEGAGVMRERGQDVGGGERKGGKRFRDGERDRNGESEDKSSYPGSGIKQMDRFGATLTGCEDREREECEDGVMGQSEAGGGKSDVYGGGRQEEGNGGRCENEGESIGNGGKEDAVLIKVIEQGNNNTGESIRHRGERERGGEQKQGREKERGKEVEKTEEVKERQNENVLGMYFILRLVLLYILTLISIPVIVLFIALFDKPWLLWLAGSGMWARGFFSLLTKLHKDTRLRWRGMRGWLWRAGGQLVLLLWHYQGAVRAVGRRGVLRRVVVALGAAVGAYLSASSQDGRFGAFLAVCATVLPLTSYRALQKK